VNGRRTLLVGGLSSIHDPLCAAALRGMEIPAVTLHARTDAGLRRARGFGNHGQCNPAHYAVGAVLDHALYSGEEPGAFADRHAWLTVGSCGPCRLAAFGLEYSRVLRGAGLARLPVILAEQLAFVGESSGSSLESLDAEAAHALLVAIVAGDALASLGRQLRPYALDPDHVETVLAAGGQEVADALERKGSLVAAMARVRARAATIALDRGRVLPRVLLVGEPWTTLADGDPSYDLVRRLALHGVEVETPTAAEWLCYRIWDAERDVLSRFEHGDVPAAVQSRVKALRRADRRVRAAWRVLARAAGSHVDISNMNELAELARLHYDPDVRGGSAHLEIGRALHSARDRTAHLVLSLKPFGCLPSAALSDGILSVLVRGRRDIGFVPIETTGDADATAESRVEMAVHTAALAAADEFSAVCVGRGISLEAARHELRAHPVAAQPSGPRTYACTAAELLWRERARSGLEAPRPCLQPP